MTVSPPLGAHATRHWPFLSIVAHGARPVNRVNKLFPRHRDRDSLTLSPPKSISCERVTSRPGSVWARDWRGGHCHFFEEPEPALAHRTIVHPPFPASRRGAKEHARNIASHALPSSFLEACTLSHPVSYTYFCCRRRRSPSADPNHTTCPTSLFSAHRRFRDSVRRPQQSRTTLPHSHPPTTIHYSPIAPLHPSSHSSTRTVPLH